MCLCAGVSIYVYLCVCVCGSVHGTRFYDLMLTNAPTCQNNRLPFLSTRLIVQLFRPTGCCCFPHSPSTPLHTFVLCVPPLCFGQPALPFCCQYVLTMFVQNANGFANVYAGDYCGVRKCVYGVAVPVCACVSSLCMSVCVRGTRVWPEEWPKHKALPRIGRASR